MSDFTILCETILKRLAHLVMMTGVSEIKPETLIRDIAKQGHTQQAVHQAVWFLLDTGKLDLTEDFKIRIGVKDDDGHYRR